MKAIIKYPVMLGFSIGILFPACTTKEKEDEAMRQVVVLSSSRDSLENELVNTLDEINQNLDQISDKQGVIASTNGAENISKKKIILYNIGLINALIADNNAKIRHLTSQTKKLGKEKNALSRIVEQTRARIEKQEGEIAALKKQLVDEMYKVEDLNRRVNDMQQNNDVLVTEKTLLTETNVKIDKDLNKAYYAFGTRKDLKEKNLIEKTGGVLGIGKKDALSNAFYGNKNLFTELDIRETKTILIQGKDPKLITFHPSGSYEIIEDKGSKLTSLSIKNTEEFWSSSKYLVVEVR